MSLNETPLAKEAKSRMSDEFSDYTLYDRLSKTVKDGSPFEEVLKHLSATELGHSEFWKKYVPGEEPRVSRFKLYWVLFLRRIFGLTFATRYLDRHEGNVVKEYESIAHLIPDSDKGAFDKMVADEKEHENAFSQKIESSTVSYISFVVLGLADALVEISGIHAGSLGFYDRTEIAGLAGVIAGAAASMAMASAAFAQARAGFKGSARLSAAYTGVSYFVTAIVLAAPYFLTANMVYALSSSLSLAVLILVLTTYYSTVIQSRPFTRDFLEILAILFGATIVLYVFGSLVRVELPGIRVS